MFVSIVKATSTAHVGTWLDSGSFNFCCSELPSLANWIPLYLPCRKVFLMRDTVWVRACSHTVCGLCPFTPLFIQCVESLLPVFLLVLIWFSPCLPAASPAPQSIQYSCILLHSQLFWSILMDHCSLVQANSFFQVCLPATCSVAWALAMETLSDHL